jgi:hypothetical protein
MAAFHKSRSSNGGNAANGTLLPRANAAACSQLAKADFASSSRRVDLGGPGPQFFCASNSRCQNGRFSKNVP